MKELLDNLLEVLGACKSKELLYRAPTGPAIELGNLLNKITLHIRAGHLMELTKEEWELLCNTVRLLRG